MVRKNNCFLTIFHVSSAWLFCLFLSIKSFLLWQMKVQWGFIRASVALIFFFLGCLFHSFEVSQSTEICLISDGQETQMLPDQLGDGEWLPLRIKILGKLIISLYIMLTGRTRLFFAVVWLPSEWVEKLRRKGVCWFWVHGIVVFWVLWSFQQTLSSLPEINGIYFYFIFCVSVHILLFIFYIEYGENVRFCFKILYLVMAEWRHFY